MNFKVHLKSIFQFILEEHERHNFHVLIDIKRKGELEVQDLAQDTVLEDFEKEQFPYIKYINLMKK